jgi:hypothetical protein
LGLGRWFGPRRTQLPAGLAATHGGGRAHGAPDTVGRLRPGSRSLPICRLYATIVPLIVRIFDPTALSWWGRSAGGMIAATVPAGGRSSNQAASGCHARPARGVLYPRRPGKAGFTLGCCLADPLRVPQRNRATVLVGQLPKLFGFCSTVSFIPDAGFLRASSPAEQHAALVIRLAASR